MGVFFKRILGYIYGYARSAYYDQRYDYFRKRYHISNSFKFSGTDIRIYGDGILEVGEGSYIGTNSTIELAQGFRVSIGKKCSISHNVRLYTSSAFSDQNFLTDNPLMTGGDITIEDGVWIGANVFVNPGIVIGANAIVGANSVVTKNVERFTIVGGVPAKFIRRKTMAQSAPG